MGKGYTLTLAVIICLVKCCYTNDASDVKPLTGQTWADKLKKDLLANYDRNIRPAQHYNVTNVDINMTITHVDIDEETSIFSVYGWVKMHWLDKRLIWEPSDYGGLQTFIVPSYYLWDPELSIHSTTLETAGTTFYASTNIRVDNRGNHSCTVRVNLKTFCEMNFRRWPFDTQHCSVVLGKSVTREEETVQMNVLPGEIVRSSQNNPSWKVIDMLIERYDNPMEEDRGSFTGVQYGIIAQRKVKIFHSTVIVPAVVCILMTLINFWLPPKATEKVLLHCINAAILCAFLLYFTMHLPLLATRTPLVVLFFSNSLYLTAFCMVMSVITMNMAKSKHRKPVHPFVKSFLTLPGISILVWSGSNIREITEDEDWNEELKTDSLAVESSSSAEETTNENRNQIDWIKFAVALERLCFIVYVFLYSVMSACYLN
ncbi:neuronal acetylcholine receptor subunit beta-4-like isoform X1 [Malaya genurostris]|uniref:neuronal acetylcholine receptor subunit beta-4-like isoform X1 n=1 Tax=Malaya genurostris TaxID=325434 RepID=UPI0026F408D9|nr:neuronal acetylcholine receptor subunit beta-4-like isoform X1 [Malaya genurostris]